MSLRPCRTETRDPPRRRRPRTGHYGGDTISTQDRGGELEALCTCPPNGRRATPRFPVRAFLFLTPTRYSVVYPSACPSQSRPAPG
ncbi:hypothetical protein AcW1_001141 [Taiwanofungus camphoratus]|nr:hypothetical protein AcW1_001141 [Antrodia cinnamomea]